MRPEYGRKGPLGLGEPADDDATCYATPSAPASFREGYDLVLVAELMGHARTETTRDHQSCPPPPTPKPSSTASPRTADQRPSLPIAGFRRTPVGPVEAAHHGRAQ